MNILSREQKCYEAPALTVVHIEVEKGYALSGLALSKSRYEAQTFGGSNRVESRTDGGNWGGSDEWIF